MWTFVACLFGFVGCYVGVACRCWVVGFVWFGFVYCALIVLMRDSYMVAFDC